MFMTTAFRHLQFALEEMNIPRPLGLGAYLANDWYGYMTGATEQELWEHNRGCWAGLRIALEGLVTFEYQGFVVCVADVAGVDVIEQFPGDDLPAARKYVGRRVMQGRALVGHPWVGTPCTHTGNQQPFTWQPDSTEGPVGATRTRSSLARDSSGRRTIAPAVAAEGAEPCGLPMLHARRLCGCFD